MDKIICYLFGHSYGTPEVVYESFWNQQAMRYEQMPVGIIMKCPRCDGRVK